MDEATLRAMKAFVEAVEVYIYSNDETTNASRQLRKACDKLGDMLDAEIEKKLS